MIGVNKVILIGNLGAEPEVREAGSSKVAVFNVATSEKYTDKDGQRQEVTEWHKVELWGKLADIAESYLRKGSKVYIEGKLKTEQWTDKNEQTRYTTKVRGLSMQMLDGRNGDSQPTAAPTPSFQPQAQPQAENTDDLPF